MYQWVHQLQKCGGRGGGAERGGLCSEWACLGWMWRVHAQGSPTDMTAHIKCTLKKNNKMLENGLKHISILKISKQILHMLKAVVIFSLLDVESSRCKVEFTSTRLLSGPRDTSAVMGDTLTGSSPIPEGPCRDTGSSWACNDMAPVSTTLTTPEFSSLVECKASLSVPWPPAPVVLVTTLPPMCCCSITTWSSSPAPCRGITPPEESTPAKPTWGWGLVPSCCWVSATTTPSMVGQVLFHYIRRHWTTYTWLHG